MASAHHHQKRSWSDVADHLEAAIASIPRPDFDTITDPKKMAKQLKSLCKKLKINLKDMLQEAKDMSFHVYSLLMELSRRIADLVSRFFHYVSEKVKSFLNWINTIVNKVKSMFSHAD